MERVRAGVEVVDICENDSSGNKLVLDVQFSNMTSIPPASYSSSFSYFLLMNIYRETTKLHLTLLRTQAYLLRFIHNYLSI